MSTLLESPFRYYYLSYFLVALMLSLFLTPLFRSLSYKIGALDRGEGRRAHQGIVPRMGGGGIYLAFALPLGFALTRGNWDETHLRMAAILVAATVVFAVGAYDDLRGAPIRNKLAVEVAAALIIYAWGIRIETISNPFNGALVLGWFSLPVTVLWVVVITNAFNLIDGLDGLAAGTGILIAAALFLVFPGESMLMTLTFLLLIGSLFGFLRHNFPPATIFMGDSGSLLVGFILASLSILASAKATAMATIMLPIIAFSHPLMDMIYAVLRRYHRGLPLGEADREHIHHKLLDMGLSRTKVLLTLYGVNLLILGGALLFLRGKYRVDFIFLAALVVAALVGLRLLGYVEFQAFAHLNIRNYQLGRKRRYFTYVLKRFRAGAAKSRTLDELKGYLEELAIEYGFHHVTITLKQSVKQFPLYVYRGQGEADKPIRLEFPITRGDEEIGKVTLLKEVDDDYLLCTTELSRSLIEGVSSFLGRNPHSLPFSS
jgi:UDP-GlcNAc:undecaprenyl-phosphate GlcNAc-1-phosphate transferase